MEKLRIWWIPQLPMKPFLADVKDLSEAKKVLNILSNYDLFQFENKIKPDYSNTGGLEVYDFDSKEWIEFEDEEGNDIWDTTLIDKSNSLKDLILDFDWTSQPEGEQFWKDIYTQIENAN